MVIQRDENGRPRITGTAKDLATVKQYMRESGMEVYLCACGGIPHTLVTYAWGVPAITITCQVCAEVSAGFAESHIEALEIAAEHWNAKQERIFLELTA